MQTKIIKINPINPEKPKIKIAANIIKSGGVVAFPTETVYGLGANALNPEAIKKIFEAKGRPLDNPLIVHINDKKDVYRLAKQIPKSAEKLMDKFWPGPLTLILNKSKIVPEIVTAGLDSVAIRLPSNKIALELIKESNAPIVAPSANLSGKPSPTLAKYVIQDLLGKINVIIDGGETEIGLESTVLDLTTNPPTLLRPGKVSLEELRIVLKKVEVYLITKRKKVKKIIAKSPGMKYQHYSPDARIILVEGKPKQVKSRIQELVNKYKKERKVVGVMTMNKDDNYKTDTTKFLGSDFSIIAKNLFKTFRDFDKEKVDLIIAEGVDDKGLGLAIMNRLRKASYKIIHA